MHVVVMRVPGKIIFFHRAGQFRRFLLQFFRRFEPVTAGGNTVHSFLIEASKDKTLVRGMR